MIIRPVTRTDQDAVLRIAEAAGIGMTSLPPDQDVLAEKVERAAQSFEGSITDAEDSLYFFVMEDPDTKEIAGTCAIEAYIGLKRPVYSYKLTTVTQYSESLDIFSRNDMLQVVNDHTGVSEIGSLFLMPEYRRDRLGRFLSRMRFLFVALFPERFADRVIAEIRGWHDGNGNAPFYDSLARHFFQMDFSRADWICATQGNRFISELMPSYPIYIDLLPKEAREVIGRPYANSEPAKAMLEREGFVYNNYIDLFDGGPTLEARTSDIRTVRESRTAMIRTVSGDALTQGTRCMIALPTFAEFRTCMGFVQLHNDGTVTIDTPSANLLALQPNDTITYTGA